MASKASPPKAAKPVRTTTTSGGRHRAPGTATPKPGAKRTPPRAAGTHARGGQLGRDARQVGTEHAERVSREHTGGRVSGASKGAIAGGLKGGGEGALIGGAGGFLGSKGAKRAKRAFTSGDPSRRLLVLEFVIAALIVSLSPITDKHRNDTPAHFTNRLAAVAGTYLVLSLVATGGRGAAKIAASFGALVATVLVISERDIFAVIGARFAAPADPGPAGPDDSSDGEGEGTPAPVQMPGGVRHS